MRHNPHRTMLINQKTFKFRAHMGLISVVSLERKIQVAQIWDNYTPSLFDRSHHYFLEHPGVKSTLIIKRLIDNGSPVLAQTHFWERVEPKTMIYPKLSFRLKQRMGRRFFEHRFNRFCSSVLEKEPVDLIHFHYGTTAALCLELLRKTQVPAMVSFYGYDASAGLKKSATDAEIAELFDRVDRVQVLCEVVGEKLVKLGCPKEKILAANLPGGVEHYSFKPREFSDGIRFVCAARFVEKKGHGFLLEAFKKVLEKRRDATLTLIGYGNIKPKIEKQIEDMGLSPFVRMIDTALSPDFIKIYRETLEQTDIFVLPSTIGSNGDEEGGVPLTLVAAQAAGLPVICTPVNGTERAVKEGVTGFFTKQDDVNSLAQKMIELAANPELCRTIGEQASRFVREQFSLEGQMRMQMGTYRGILERKNVKVH